MSLLRREHLESQHTDEAIADRLSGGNQHSFLGDFVLGAVDGTVTTFAVVSGVAGANLPNGAGIALVLGLANLFADGFSMAAGNYLAAQADQQVVERMRKLEEHHVKHIPEGEREEVRQIFAAKGFEGPLLDQIVDVITQDRKRWVDTMLTEEFGLQLESRPPLKAALATFTAFAIAGFVPLLPFCLSASATPNVKFAVSAVATALTFFIIGIVKGRIVGRPILRSGLETLLIGGAAAAMAYIVGVGLKDLAGGQ